MNERGMLKKQSIPFANNIVPKYKGNHDFFIDPKL